MCHKFWKTLTSTILDNILTPDNLFADILHSSLANYVDSFRISVQSSVSPTCRHDARATLGEDYHLPLQPLAPDHRGEDPGDCRRLSLVPLLTSCCSGTWSSAARTTRGATSPSAPSTPATTCPGRSWDTTSASAPTGDPKHL